MEWSNLTSQSGSEFFRSSGVSERHISEILNAATRATYGQGADSINALSTALANILNTLTIIRGHRQVFENFVREANATLFLNSHVSTFRMINDARQFLTDSRQGQEHKMELECKRVDGEEHERLHRLQKRRLGHPNPHVAYFPARIVDRPSPRTTA